MSIFKEFIRRVTSARVAGKTDDVRETQAKRYWVLGVGTPLRYRSFGQYLANIPEIPEALKADDASFPILVLVEPRIGLKRLCDLGGIEFDADDKSIVGYDDRHAEFAQPTWFRMQDGRKNRNRSVSDCRNAFAEQERGLTALQGVCAYLQHPTVVSEWAKDGAHVMDLPGSIPREGVGGSAACLRVHEGRAKLGWTCNGNATPKCGSASRRER